MEVWQRLLKLGQSKHICTACNRHLDDGEMKVFEKYVCGRPALRRLPRLTRPVGQGPDQEEFSREDGNAGRGGEGVGGRAETVAEPPPFRSRS
jgi:hypothetical protein